MHAESRLRDRGDKNAKNDRKYYKTAAGVSFQAGRRKQRPVVHRQVQNTGHRSLFYHTESILKPFVWA